MLFVARSLLAVGLISLPLPASAKDCAAWNNWCSPACGELEWVLRRAVAADDHRTYGPAKFLC
jgi:hypothetical protein